MAFAIGPVLEEHIYQAGLLAVQRAVGDAELLSFPKRPNGTPLLLRQSFFERVFSGKMTLSSFPGTDLIAAQTDVRNLSLPQLLFLRCGNLDASTPGQPSMRAHSEFLATVGEALEKSLGRRLFRRGELEATQGKLADIVRLVLLSYGVHEGLNKEVVGSSEHWFLRSGELQALLHLPSCELLELGPLSEIPAFCHRNLSRASASVPRPRKQLHWEVELCPPCSFDAGASQSPSRRSRPSLNGGRPSLARSITEEHVSEAILPVDPELAALLRKRMEEAEATVEELRRELEDSKQGAAEVSELCKQLKADKLEADTSRDATQAQLTATRAELKGVQEKLEQVTAAEAKASREVSELKGKAADAKGAEAKNALKASSLRTELSFAKEAEARLEAEVARLREELAATKKQCSEPAEAAKSSEKLAGQSDEQPAPSEFKGEVDVKVNV